MYLVLLFVVAAAVVVVVVVSWLFLFSICFCRTCFLLNHPQD